MRSPQRVGGTVFWDTESRPENIIVSLVQSPIIGADSMKSSNVNLENIL